MINSKSFPLLVLVYGTTFTISPNEKGFLEGYHSFYHGGPLSHTGHVLILLRGEVNILELDSHWTKLLLGEEILMQRMTTFKKEIFSVLL